MKAQIVIDIVYVDERVLIRTTMEGAPTNIVDISAVDAEELELAIGKAIRSVRRQILERAIAGAHKPSP